MPAPLPDEFLRDFGERWLAAWNSHSSDRLLELLHPEITWDDTVFWPAVIEGIDGMPAYLDKIWDVMPDVQFEDVQVFTAPEDGRALCLFRQSGSAPERFGGPEKKFSTFGCDIFLEFKDGLLFRYLGQYEIVEMMRQFGALPPRNGRIGGAYLLSLMSGARQT
jgi:hypothetical protein